MTDPASSVRLNKFLALALGFSRRQADDLIAQGDVTINGEVAIIGARFDPATQNILVKGEKIATDTKFRYIAFNKPVGYVCSRRAQGDAPTIYDLLPTDFRAFKPVGRLDKDSSGIILLTNDGDFAHTMTHPSFHKTKQYEVTLDRDLEPLHRQMISDHGVMLDDGPSKLQLERQQEGDNARWIVQMHEGRNRQIRRTFAALGYEVVRLNRTRFGDYLFEDLDSGKWREIQK